jgi:hypothetical protein
LLLKTSFWPERLLTLGQQLLNIWLLLVVVEVILAVVVPVVIAQQVDFLFLALLAEMPLL